ncbi:MAG: glyoxylate/hydroxypyruvate reductase A [Magnetospirillum gryphiswaldense]|nr:glyoxylate/hydroxypyruvate reductase A [Magnetospirillum gryphiswaldense]
MTRPPIALVTRLDAPAERAWRDHLAAALPDEDIIRFGDMDSGQRVAADIAIIANPDPASLALLPNLRWCHSLWAGVERLVTELPADAPPIVRLVDPELSRVMAEAVLAWAFYLHRDMPAYARQQKARQWRQLPYRPPWQKIVGVLGLGELGLAASRALQQAGFAVEGWSRSAKDLPGMVCHHGPDGLGTLLGRCDIIVCLLPLTPDTRGLLNADLLARVKTGAGLINFGRGAVLVIDDVLAALDEGRLSHAVLDVFEVEPLPPDSPLWGHPSVTVLPHVSAPTSPHTAAAVVGANIAAYRADGILPPVVDRRRGY